VIMMQRPTYAITLRQPYVELILRGIKKEHRGRPTDIRGRVYLYASKRPADSPVEWQKVAAYPGMLPTGVIVGAVEIVNCRWDEQGLCYVCDLRNPSRLVRSLRPKNQPNPGFWCPEF
jgi:hypothetical protein